MIEGTASAIPAELRERRQWVVWRLEERDAKPTKVPHRSDGSGRASSTDPGTWSTFAEATAAAIRFDGIGYVFSAEDPYVGIDLDDALPESDRSAIMAALDSYTETSVSGRGVHVIVRASLNGYGRNRRGPFEVYEHGRYFVVTGNHVRGTPATIEERQAQLDEILARYLPAVPPEQRPARAPQPVDLDDRDLLDRAMRAKNGGEFSALWDGGWEGRYLSQSEADLALCSSLAFWTGADPTRVDDLFRRSGLMREKWDSTRGDSTYGAATVATACGSAREVYRGSAADVRRAAAPRTQRAAESASAPGAPAAVADLKPDADASAGALEMDSDEGLDDIGNASRYVAQHGDALRHVPLWGEWLIWDGSRWAADDVLEHRRRAAITARSLVEEAFKEGDEDRRKRLLGHAGRSAGDQRLRAMVNVASADPKIVVRPSQLDGDPWVLNTRSGIVDLRTRTLGPHDPGGLHTKLTGGAYRPDAACPIFQALLQRVLPDEEIRRFLQRLAGVSAIGVTREHVLPILVGTGRNGKSTVRNALASALGDYADQSGLDLLMQGGRTAGRATPELADLRGLRFVTVSETPQDGRLASERVKAITGGEPIRARRLNNNPFTFTPSHTVWLSTNHRPRVSDETDAIWDRILLIDFPVKIPDDEQDGSLGEKLASQTELDGILRWVVDGAHAYLDGGLRIPPSVRAATSSYREEEDTFGAFVNERTAQEPDSSVGATELLTAHNTWAASAGAQPITRNALADKLVGLGYQRRTTNTGKRWLGLRITQEGTLDD